MVLDSIYYYLGTKISYDRILMPARRLTFTPENISAAWEAVGIIPFNPRRVLGGVKRENKKVSDAKGLTGGGALPVPKTPRAVSRTTRTAISLVTRNTPSSQKLKSLLSGLSEGFQQTIADKVVEEEAHRLYRELVGKVKAGKTSDRRKLTEATVVTSETILQLREDRERVDAAKAARKVNKASRTTDSRQTHTMRSKPATTTSLDPTPGTPATDPSVAFDEADQLWEEMEALEVGGEGIGESSGGVAGIAIRVRGRR